MDYSKIVNDVTKLNHRLIEAVFTGTEEEMYSIWEEYNEIRRNFQEEAAAEPHFTCPRCNMTSYNPNDVREGYCGHCHDWTRDKA